VRQLFDNAWYATPKKFNGIVKFIAYDDRGSLNMSPDEIRFVGRKVDVSVRRVVAVSLVRQQIPWPAYAVVNLVLVALLVVIHPLTAFDLAYVVALNLVGLSIAVGTKWVKIDYEDEPNGRQSVYFADGSIRGWGGILGGTKELYRAIQDHSRVGEVPAAY
jgi:hypothetical protein